MTYSTTLLKKAFPLTDRVLDVELVDLRVQAAVVRDGRHAVVVHAVAVAAAVVRVEVNAAHLDNERCFIF